MKLALRTQQVIAEETNVTNVIDPLGGSWYVEALTNDLEAGVWEYLERVEELGGTLRAVEANFQQGEVADFAYGIAQRKQAGEHVVVGVNKYRDEGDEPPIEVHRNDAESERRQVESLTRFRATRDDARLEQLMTQLREVARDRSANVMPATIEAVKAGATMGEIVVSMREVFGAYVENPVF